MFVFFIFPVAFPLPFRTVLFPVQFSFPCCFLSRACHGTGSYPLPPQGWQRRILLTARYSPFTGPCFTRACRAYSEQVGVKRHDGGVNGDMHLW